MMDDECMSMQTQISQLYKSAWLQLRQIVLIREHLDETSTKRIIHAFVTSKLDNHNGLLYGVPKTKLQNAPAH